jgi:hypothetical protein
MRRYLHELFATFPEWRVWVEEIQETPDGAVAKVRVRAKSVAGVPAEFTDRQAIVLRDGKAGWWAFYRTRAQALEALGPSC